MKSKVINGSKYKCDGFESKVKLAKSKGIKLNYGASNNLPISVSRPENEYIEELFMIDLMNVPRDKWFDY